MKKQLRCHSEGFSPKNPKKAFTLAEVLITLSIIGVVAAMTVPALQKQMNDSQLKVALKKSYSTLSGTMKSIIKDQGGTIKGAYTTDNQLKNGFAVKMNIVKDCNHGSSAAGNCWISISEWMRYDGDAYPNYWGYQPSIIAADGIMYKFHLIDSACNDDNSGGMKNDLTRCGWVMADVNGFKKPNTNGKDIFLFYILENRLLPAGGAISTADCAYIGFGCTADMLLK